MSRLKRLWILIGFGVLVWIAFQFIPNDEKKIRSTLEDLVRTVSIEPEDGNIQMWRKSERMLGFFTDDLAIEIEGLPEQGVAIRSKMDLSQAFLSIRLEQIKRLEVRLADLLIKIAPDQETATVFTSALVRMNDAKDSFAQELKFHMEKNRGQWLINHVQAIQTLQ